MNPGLGSLHPYPFEKLAALMAGAEPPAALSHIALSIGEPKHPTPAFITEEVMTHLHQLCVYPATRGMLQLRQSIADWLCKRFQLDADSLDPDAHILPLNGTREGLFAFAQAIVDAGENSLVLMPNPFYQIYEGAGKCVAVR